MANKLGVYNTIMSSIEGKRGDLFPFEAPGGIGKTFNSNLLLAQQCQMKHIALAVASTGIVATPARRWPHRSFLLQTPFGPVHKIESNQKQRFWFYKSPPSDCKLVICDEVTMGHKCYFEALDTAFQYLTHNTRLMRCNGLACRRL